MKQVAAAAEIGDNHQKGKTARNHGSPTNWRTVKQGSTPGMPVPQQIGEREAGTNAPALQRFPNKLGKCRNATPKRPPRPSRRPQEPSALLRRRQRPRPSIAANRPQLRWANKLAHRQTGTLRRPPILSRRPREQIASLLPESCEGVYSSGGSRRHRGHTYTCSRLGI